MRNEKRLRKLVDKIWDQGGLGRRRGPRFCLSDVAPLKVLGKEITHYDFFWKERGHLAMLSLYQGLEEGEVTYGAVLDKNLHLVRKLQFFWNGYHFVLEE